MKLLSTPVIYGLGALLAAAVIWGGVQTYRLAGAQRDAAVAREALAISARDATIARLEFEASARLREQEYAKEAQSWRAATAKRIADVKAEAARLEADLRAGNVRLRREWASSATADLSAGAAAAAGPDGATDLQAASLGRVSRVLGDAEARYTELQRRLDAAVRLTRPPE